VLLADASIRALLAKVQETGQRPASVVVRLRSCTTVSETVIGSCDDELRADRAS